MSSDSMMNRAMHFLAQGNCTEHMLYGFLNKEYEREPNLQSRIKDILLRLHQLDLINDARVARRIAERFSNKGNGVIVQQLNNLGINKIHAQSALAFIGTEFERALREAQLKCATCEGTDLHEMQNQIMRLLSSRSFSYQTLRQVMDTLFNQNLLTISSMENRTDEVNHSFFN